LITKPGTSRQNILNGGFCQAAALMRPRLPVPRLRQFCLSRNGRKKFIAEFFSSPWSRNLVRGYHSCRKLPGGRDFFGYFLGHKKVTGLGTSKDLFTGVLCLRMQAWEDISA